MVALLKGIITAGFNPEYELGGINDPLLQIHILHLLRILGQGHAAASEQMNDVLMQVSVFYFLLTPHSLWVIRS